MWCLFVEFHVNILEHKQNINGVNGNAKIHGILAIELPMVRSKIFNRSTCKYIYLLSIKYSLYNTVIFIGKLRHPVYSVLYLEIQILFIAILHSFTPQNFAKAAKTARIRLVDGNGRLVHREYFMKLISHVDYRAIVR